jgi:hypothetical protein
VPRRDVVADCENERDAMETIPKSIDPNRIDFTAGLQKYSNIVRTWIRC